MRKFGLIVLLFIVSFVGAQELQAMIFGEARAAGSNCLQGSMGAEPNHFDFGVTVTNPSEKSLSVSYEWYNSSSGTFVSGGKICDVIAGINMTAQCVVRIYSVFGGINGTDSVTFNVIGNDSKNIWTRSLAVTIEHYRGTFEQNAINKTNVANKERAETTTMLATCYSQDAEALLNEASSELMGVDQFLKACNIAKVLNLTNEVISKIRMAKEDIRAIPTELCKPKNAPPEFPPNTTITPPETTIESTISSITSIVSVAQKLNCFGVTLFLLVAAALILLKR
jgi:hypothetical protein